MDDRLGKTERPCSSALTRRRSACTECESDPSLRYVERRLDGLVQLADFGSVACTHQPLQSVTWDREYVVEIGDTSDGQPLLAAKDDFGRELANRSGDQRDDDRTDAAQNGIPGQDYDGPATDG